MARRRFQIHLSTASVMLLLGPLCLINCWSKEEPTKIDLPEIVFLPRGKITLGPPKAIFQQEVTHADERNIEVTVAGFGMSKTPIDATQFCAFLNSSYLKKNLLIKEKLYFFDGHMSKQFHYSNIELDKEGKAKPRKDSSRAPANRVTWLGAVHFCTWASKVSRRKLRLPTEVEWEYAARGKEGRIWPWGNEKPTNEFGWRWKRNEWNADAPWLTVSESVGKCPKNATPDGILDLMAFVIGEWCINRYESSLNPPKMMDKNLYLEDLKSERVVRGGFHKRKPWALPFESSWHDGRTWTRLKGHPLNAPKLTARHGFRIVEEAPEEDVREGKKDAVKEPNKSSGK